MPKTSRPVAIVAPLDWGLGHATRCIPLINFLLSIGYEVVIAAEGNQKALLQLEFPSLVIVSLPGYKLRYGHSKWGTIFNIFLQIPKILLSVQKENKWLKKYAAEKKVDIVISDNRYGFYLQDVPSYFITHQLRIKIPFGRMAEKILQKINYGFIKKFSACLIPDYIDAKNLAGELSHPENLPPVPVQYIGHLSRFKKMESAITNPLLILISGPEPQRSCFEKLVINQLHQYNIAATVVRGLPKANNLLKVKDYIKVHNHLPAHQLGMLINESSVIISRSGYSTIMDVLPLGKKCIFIPTPGQSEQEYLAKYLSQKNMCVYVSQNDFDLCMALRTVNAENLNIPAFPYNYFEEEIRKVLKGE